MHEQIRKYNTIIDHFINNIKQIYANKKQYKLFKKVMFLIDINIFSKNEDGLRVHVEI